MTDQSRREFSRQVTAALGGFGLTAVTRVERGLSFLPGRAPGAGSTEPPMTMYLEPPRRMQAPGFDWEHEIRVALPAGYHHTKKTYPVLWLTDGSPTLELAVGVLQLLMPHEAPELILVSVGAPRDVDVAEFARRRTFEFGPTEEMLYHGVGGDLLRKFGPSVQPKSGGAERFLDFLIHDVRPALLANYRMDPRDHGLYGHSGGGMFVGYAMFREPAGFTRYICGSPSLNGGDFEIFRREERYAASHPDLPARVFFGAGETEIESFGTAAWSVVGSMTRMAETLRMRRYPSLHVATRIFRDETHSSVPPFVLSHGVRAVWSDLLPPPAPDPR